MLLIGELRVARLLVPVAPKIPNRGPIIPMFELRCMPVPPGPLGCQGSFTQASGPSYGLVYSPNTLSGAGPSTGPFTGGNDSDDADTDSN